MKGAQLLKVFTGQPGDDVAALAAEIDVEKTKAAEACSRVEWLRLERKTADDFAAAKSLDEQIAEAEWTIERADAILPHLEGRLRAARTEKQAIALSRHQKVLRARYPKFRAALLAAVEQQAEVIRERELAVAELGEHLVQMHLAHIAYAGFLFKDLLALWTAENDRIFAEPASKPAIVAPRPAPVTVAAKPVVAEKPMSTAAPSAPRYVRPPRRDAEPGEGQRLVTIIRSGADIDGFQVRIGDQIAVPIAAAEALIKAGAADFIGETK